MNDQTFFTPLISPILHIVCNLRSERFHFSDASLTVIYSMAVSPIKASLNNTIYYIRLTAIYQHP